jgi:TM2 domain-containing membrane protein YozV
MRGKVLHYDDVAASGLISGDDGNRYAFTRGDLMGSARSASPGTDVDFRIDAGTARDVFLQIAPAEGKSRIAAALLAFFLGVFGVHKFYLGRRSAGIIMLVCGTLGWLLVLPGMLIAIIAFIEFVIYLVKTDQDFQREYVAGDKAWF